MGGKRERRPASQRGFYDELWTREEIEALRQALEQNSLQDEIGLLKVLIKRAVDNGADATTITPAINALVRAYRVRHVISGDAARSLDEALAAVIREVGAEFGLSG